MDLRTRVLQSCRWAGPALAGFCLDMCHAWAAGEELVDTVLPLAGPALARGRPPVQMRQRVSLGWGRSAHLRPPGERRSRTRLISR